MSQTRLSQKYTYATAFSGIGIGTQGLKLSGGCGTVAIEMDPLFAKIHGLNHPDEKVIVDKIEHINIQQLPIVDLWLFTPSCRSFSAANNKRGEKSTVDIIAAEAIAEIILAKKPKHILLENVPLYAKTKSFQIILDALSNYNYQVLNLDSHNFGIPQSRKRMYLIANHQEFLWKQFEYIPNPSNGWLFAIADCIDECKIMPLSKTQQKFHIHTNYWLSRQKNKPMQQMHRFSYEPAFTITSHSRDLRICVNQNIYQPSERCLLRCFGKSFDIVDKIYLPLTYEKSVYAIGQGACWEIIEQLASHLVSCSK